MGKFRLISALLLLVVLQEVTVFFSRSANRFAKINEIGRN
jgi:hypothetical protein